MMALPKNDHWTAVLGLVAVAAGYWYWTHKNQGDTTGNLVAANQISDEAVSGPIITGMDQISSGVVPASMVFNPNASINTPNGPAVTSNSQTLTLPMNS